MPQARQASFSAGELSPKMWGRTESELYAHGARLLRNVLVTKTGAVVSRPGLRMVKKMGPGDGALFPYSTGAADEYVLAVVGSTANVCSKAGNVLTSFNAPWTPAWARKASWAQAGRYLYVGSKMAAPRVLKWPSIPMSVAPLKVTLDSISARTANGQGIGHVFMTRLHSKTDDDLFVGDAAHPPRSVVWRYSTVFREVATGREVEGFSRTVIELTGWPGAITGEQFVLYESAPITFSRDRDGGRYNPAGYEYLRTRLYRGAQSNTLDGLGGAGGSPKSDAAMGLIAEGNEVPNLVDVNKEPDFLDPPILGKVPWGDDAPGALTFFEGRMVLASTPQQLDAMWLSAPFRWDYFELPVKEGNPAAPMQLQPLSMKLEAIVGMYPHHKLLVFTDGGVWSLASNGGEFRSETATFRREEEVGAEEIQPVASGRHVFFVRKGGRGVHALSLMDNGAYGGADTCWQAEHLFAGKGRKVVSWCVQREPWGTVWAVLEDGTMVTMTRTGDGLWAWTRIETAGQFLACTCVHWDGRDAVVVLVRRGQDTFLEEFGPVSDVNEWDSQDEVPLDDAAHPGYWPSLDCWIQEDIQLNQTEDVEVGDVMADSPFASWAVSPRNGWQLLSNFTRSFPFGHPNQSFTATAPVGPFEASNITDATRARVFLGLGFECDVELLDAASAGRLNQKAVSRVGLELSGGPGFWVGEDEAHLVEWRSRKVADGYDFPSPATEFVTIQVQGSWRKSGRAWLKQKLPLPFALYGVTRDVSAGQ